MSSPRVCYFGGYDPDYARHKILLRGLALQGVSLTECRVSPKLSTREKIKQLGDQFKGCADSCDLILLPAFNQSLAPFAFWLAKRYGKRLIVDAFTSVYDSAVHDRGSVSPRSLSAMRYWLIDRLSLLLADRVLIDTVQHRDYFVREFGASAEKFRVIPVGASQEWFDIQSIKDDNSFTKVLFYGTYIPLHGIEAIIEAVDLLWDRNDIHFELIGKGQTYPVIRDRADSLGLENLTFTDSMPIEALQEQVAGADICLGIFGRTDKAHRVVPNKVYQALAAGKPLITGDTPAIRQVFDDEHLIAVPPGDSQSLAEAIRTLADSPEHRDRLGNLGKQKMLENFTETQIGKQLLEAIG